MKWLMVWIAPVLVFVAAPTALHAKVTRQQIVERCKPQLDTFLRVTIAEEEQTIAKRRAEAAQPFDNKGEMTKDEIRAYRDDDAAETRRMEAELADYRAHGAEAEEMRAYLDQMAQAGSKIGKADVRAALAEARQYSVAQTPVEVCALETILADLEGRSVQPAAAGKTAAISTSASGALSPPSKADPAPADSGLFTVERATSCLEYTLLPEVLGRKYFQERNTCNYAVVVYDKVELDGVWNTYHDLNREIAAYETAKSGGDLAKQMLVTKMTVCPAKSTLERRLGKKVTGVYTSNGTAFGCWSRLENTGVGRAN